MVSVPSGTPFVTRVVTFDSNDNFVNYNEENSVLGGICIDLWQRTAKDLNITYEMKKVDSWQEMMESLRKNESDVLVNSFTDWTMIILNITK